MTSSVPRALARLIVYLSLTFALMPVQAASLLLRSSFAVRLPLIYHRMCRSILGFRLEVAGRVSTAHPTLFVANHISYIDIMILGSILPASFIAKLEVKGWPLFGWLAKLQRTVFIERRAARIAGHRDDLTERFAAGDNLILFAEGTSSDGNQVLPFKSALFSAAEADAGDRPVTVQPVTIAYTRIDGIPVGRVYRPYVAWYGDMDMFSHLMQLIGLGTVTVTLIFHDPVRIGDFGSRKALAQHCHAVVSEALSAANGGRLAVRPRLDSAGAGVSV